MPRQERHIPLPTKVASGALAAFALVAGACASKAGGPEKNPTEEPTATRVSQLETATSQSPTPKPEATATEEHFYTPDGLISLLEDSLVGVAETSELDVLNAKVEINQAKQNWLSAESDKSYIGSAIGAYAMTDKLVAKLACLNQNQSNEKLPEAYREIKRFAISYAQGKIQDGLYPGSLDTIENTLFSIPSDCPNQFLASQR